MSAAAESIDLDLDDLPPELARLHSVALVLAEQLVGSEQADEEFAPYSAELMNEIEAFLLSLAEGDSEELVHAVRTIAAFSEGNSAASPRLAEQLEALLRREPVHAALKAWSMSSTDPEEVRTSALQFGSFSGNARNRPDPLRREQTQKEAIDIHGLSFPKRM